MQIQPWRLHKCPATRARISVYLALKGRVSEHQPAQVFPQPAASKSGQRQDLAPSCASLWKNVANDQVAFAPTRLLQGMRDRPQKNAGCVPRHAVPSRISQGAFAQVLNIEKGIKNSPANTVSLAQAGVAARFGRCQGGLAAGSISIFSVLK